MNRLILWRHGQTAWNAAARFQGQTDIELDDAGRAQAVAAAELLAAQRPTRIVSSDLRRALDTAYALAAVTGLPVETDKRLRERSFGEWETLTRNEVEARYPESWARWLRHEPVTDHGIEAAEDVVDRVRAVLAEITAGEGLVVAVTHGATSRLAIDALTGVSGMSGAMEVLLNCRWTELRPHGDRWRLHAHNAGLH